MGLKDMIFKDSPEKESKKAKENASTIAPVTQQSVTNMAGVVDEKFVEMLWSVISQNNIPGQDYFEFKQAVDSMSSLAIDERSKFLTTFTIFQGQGCKKDTLLSSIDSYMRVIKSELSSFNAEFESQRQQKVTAKLAQVEKAKKNVEELNREITEANNFILTASQEAQQEEMQLQMTAHNFERSAEKVLGTLQVDKDKINNYIQ